MIVEVNGGPEGAGPRVEVKQGGGCQGQQGDDGRGRERGEQQLEKEFHGAGKTKVFIKIQPFDSGFKAIPYLKYTVILCTLSSRYRLLEVKVYMTCATVIPNHLR